ncbi:MAG: type II toxin-antitoxin system VapC family toxin [Candidatus Sulfotelmatobacter sp.]
MPATLTYIDSGVLIFAARGTTDAAALALPFLGDPNREYVTSDYVRLEVLPKATFHERTAEVAFYNLFFTTTTRSIPTSEALLQYALEEACKTGIHGLDAVHIACAVFAGAQEFITSEKTNRPIHRTKLVKVVSIFPGGKTAKRPWWKFWRE